MRSGGTWMMQRWTHTRWGQSVARLLVVALLLQPLWDVSQAYRWEPMAYLRALNQAFRLLSPSAADAAEVDASLEPGFNLFAYPVEAPPGLTCVDLQQTLAADAVSHLNPATQQFDACISPTAVFPIQSGEGYIIETMSGGVFPFSGASSCPQIDLLTGVNLVGVPSAPEGFGCHDMLRAIGDATTISAIQRFNAITGAFEACAHADGQASGPVGVNFPIVAGEAYLVHMRQDVLGLNLNDLSKCLACLAFDPTQGPIGGEVRISGAGFVPGSTTVAFNGVSAALSAETPTRLTAVVPAGAATGPLTLTESGATVSCGTFRVNQPPVLDAIGDQTAPLGDSMTFVVSGSDPDNDAVTLTVSPLPLPRGATFNVLTGQFTFQPVADQAGLDFTLTFCATDGQLQTCETIVVTVPPLMSVTTLEGVVRTTDSAPLEGVRLVFGTTTPVETFSQADGSFLFPSLPVAGKRRLLIDGSTVPGFPVGTFATVPEQIHVIEGAANVLEAPIFLLPLDLASADPITPETTSTVTSSPVDIDGQMFASIEMTVAPNSAEILETGEPYAGLVSISRIPSPDLGPRPLPDDIDLSLYIAIQPFGVSYTPPADVAFPNVEGFPVGAVVDIFGLNHETGQMEKEGDGIVEADGMIRSGTLNPDGSFTRHGVIRENSWHGFVPQPPDDDDDSGDGGGGGGSDPPPCPAGSVACSQSGDLTVSHNLVSYRSMGVERALRLEYHSTHAFPHPVVSRLWTPGNFSPPPVSMSARLQVAGVEEGTEIFFAGPPCTGFSCPFARFPRTIDATAFTTGVYPAALTLSCHFPISRRDATYTNDVPIVNQIDSPFGAGWSLVGLERIHRAVTGDLLITHGGIRPLIFTPALRARAGIARPGQQAFYQFAANLGEVISLRMNRRTNQPDGSSTLDPSLELRDSRGFVLAADDNSGEPLVNGPGQEAAILSFTLPATDTYTVVARGAGGTTGPYDLFLTTANDTPLVERQLSAPAAVEPSFVFNDQIDTPFGTNTHGFAASINTRVTIEVNRLANQPDGSGSLDPALELRDSQGFLIASNDNAGSNLPPGPGRNALLPSFTLPATDSYTVSVMGAGGTTGPYEMRITFGDLTGSIDVSGDGAVIVEPVVLSPKGDFSTLTENPDGSFARRMKDGIVKNYDADGFLTSIVDPNGNTTQYAYTGDQLTSITDPVGKDTQLFYSGNHLVQVIDPAARVTEFEHDSIGNLIRITDPDGATRQFDYDGQHLLTSQTSPRGVITPEPDDFVTRYEYDASGRFFRSTLPGDGAQRELVSNQSLGLLPVPTGCGGPTPDSGCPENLAPVVVQANLLSQYVDAESRETRLLGQDSGGRPSSIVRPLNRTTTIMRDLNGQPTRIIPPTGQAVSIAYDDRGNRVQITDELLGSTTRREYDSVFNQVLTLSDPLENTMELIYDQRGNLIEVRTAMGRITRFSWTTNGQLATLTTPLGTLNTFTYDIDRNLTTITSGAGTDQRIVHIGYNTANQITTIIDSENRITTVDRDTRNRIEQIIFPDGATTHLVYDSEENIVSLSPPGRPPHGFSYDERGRLSEYNPPQAFLGPRSTVYTYNRESQLVRVDIPDVIPFTFEYDPAGEVDTVSSPTGNFHYEYGATSGSLLGITAPSGDTLSFTYFGANLISQAWAGAGTVTGNVSWTLRADRQLETRSANGNATVNFEYDNDGLLIQAGDMEILRDSKSGLISSSRLGSTVISLDYNSFREITGKEAYYNLEVVFSHRYIRDKLGRIHQELESVEGESNDIEYEYDLAGRLKTVRRNGQISSTYEYDLNGNRLSRISSSGSIAAVYDAQDRLLQYGEYGYNYTANGELQAKIHNPTGEQTIYLYDSLGNLRSVSLPGGEQIEYIIDGANRRIGKKVNGVFVQGFLFADRLNPIAELDSSGSVVSRYVYGADPNVPSYLVREDGIYRLISDQSGNVRLVINTVTGNIAQRIDYDEFGNILLDTNVGFQPFAFAGGIYDPDTGLVRFGARDYDPSVGRWTARIQKGLQLVK